MLRTIIITVCFVSMFLSSCQNVNITKKTDRKVNIAIVIPSSHDNNSEELASVIESSLLSNCNTDLAVHKYTQQNFKYSDIFASNRPDLIVGPILSSDAIPLINFAAQYNIPLITLSNNNLLANNKDVFICGHCPMEREEAMLNYLIEEGYKDFIFIGFNNANSRTIYHFIKDYLSKHNISIQASQFLYADPVALQESFKEVTRIVNEINESDECKYKPVLYISAEALSNEYIQNYIKHNSLDKKAIISTNASTPQEKSDTELELIFPGSIDFWKQDKVKLDSSLLQILAHDTGMLISHHIGLNFQKKLFLHRLKSTQDLPSLGGIMSIEHGITKRKYDILKQSGSSISKLK